MVDGLDAGSLLNDQGYAARIYGSLREAIEAAGASGQGALSGAGATPDGIAAARG